jgi:ubiquinone/menaquinone biosynthesis C-methylase UbiE
MNKDYTPIEQKVQGDYDQIADAFSRSRKDMRWPELDAMIEELNSGDKILDIGCGTGRLCNQVEEKGVEYHGVDISRKELELARKACPAGDFQLATMRNLPFEDETFDVIFHIASLHHLLTKQERLEALGEAYRVLKPGGTFHLTVMGLFQMKFWRLFVKKAQGKATLPEPMKKSVKFFDVFLPWSWESGKKVQRYYHAFRKGELKKLFKQGPLTEISIKFIKNGKVVPFYKAKNIVVHAKKAV